MFLVYREHGMQALLEACMQGRIRPYRKREKGVRGMWKEGMGWKLIRSNTVARHWFRIPSAGSG